MPIVKIEPTSANGFKVEIYNYTEKGEVLAGVLECHTDGKKLYILRREHNFRNFRVSTTIYEKGKNPESKELTETHNLTIEV